MGMVMQDRNRSGKARTKNRRLAVGSDFQAWQEAYNRKLLVTPDSQLGTLERNLKRMLQTQVVTERNQNNGKKEISPGK